MKKIVSVSLGSSTRDHRVRVNWLGEDFDISRVGFDGSLQRAIAYLRELDGTVDAIGLGGIDVYLYAGSVRYALRDGLRMLDAVKKTPVVDGSGLKNSLERETVAYLQREGIVDFRDLPVLMVSALDRFGMAQALVAVGAKVLFGDFIFALGIDKPVSSLSEFEALAAKYLPDACKLPFQFFYPTGKKQERPPEPRFSQYYADAALIAGDFHFIRQHMPDDLARKTVLTNTVTAENVQELQDRGVARLITTTPNLGGRSFGTNVMEAALLSLLGKRWQDVTETDYLALLRRLDFAPRVESFGLVKETAYRT
ncbi:MAG: quinate 5-dehydrogenase [Candidatus Eremiobacteraeota bacterium]|nr:quinate 5-dehydrogenase [Candidatus Eremiobacteraeota bacterium]MBC5827554.1 quinate 5-dehydrogenase [Candidatus Eremiobacteraeota bacterium]